MLWIFGDGRPRPSEPALDAARAEARFVRREIARRPEEFSPPLTAKECDVDRRNLISAELQVADSVTPYCAELVVPRTSAAIRSATTAAWPSAKTPARGVP